MPNVFHRRILNTNSLGTLFSATKEVWISSSEKSSARPKFLWIRVGFRKKCDNFRLRCCQLVRVSFNIVITGGVTGRRYNYRWWYSRWNCRWYGSQELNLFLHQSSIIEHVACLDGSKVLDG
ncbi:hypothetical protein AVEN_243601-1 [Araneus ventricosus]|uniref:Uncharacterized protein n=1 Tax=Araneus ventricosus TaxID=182803 RepID=A0A4Y2A599_ARAVE|nr:hypothetical protein AVEN_243601-1 [Araneus ventricosus]